MNIIKTTKSKKVITKELYVILGIGLCASHKEIKEAYRNLSKIHHPDAGGDRNVFNKICEAYHILADNNKRIRYDDGEDPISILKPRDNEALKIISELLIKILTLKDPEQDNIVKDIKDGISENINNLNSEIKRIETMKKKLEKTLSKIISKGKSNIIKDAAEGHISMINADIKKIKDAKANFEKAKELIEDYGYDIVEFKFDFKDIPFATTSSWGI